MVITEGDLKMKTASQKVLALVFTLLISASMLTGLTIILVAESGNNGATVHISPSNTSARVDQSFEISINVSGVSDLYGWEFKLGYNNSLLELVDSTEGSFLSSSRDTFFVPKTMSTDGYVLAGCTSLRNISGVNGNGTLATVEFRAKALGSCTLDLYDTKLVNSAKQLMDHSEVDGIVTASGSVTIRVQYLDGAPRSGADVRKISPPPIIILGITDQNGLMTSSGVLGGPQDYLIDAFWNHKQIGGNTPMHVDSNGDGSATITGFDEVTSPAITILSPQNQTYDGRLAPLNFTVYDYSPISWMGYSLDGQANTTVTSNVTLNVGAGSHRVVVYSNDTYGNMGSSDVVYFASLGGCVVIKCQYLDGGPRSGAAVAKIDPSPTIPLGVSNESGLVTRCGVLDPGNYLLQATYGGSQFGPNTPFTVNGNGDGSATITNMFLEITPPVLEILSPQNLTYFNSSVPLTFAVYDFSPISWMGYSLDSQPNITVTGNTIISVEDGAHEIVVYANDTFGNMGSSQMVCFTVNSSLYEPWETSFIGLDRYPIVDFAVYNGSLYAAADSRLYAYDGTSWNVIDAPAFVTSLEPYGDKLVVGGQGGLYCYDGTSFSLIFSVPTYIKVLGVYNSTLYAGTFLDNPPKLYYCNGSVDNPSDWHIDTGFSTILNFSGAFGSMDSFAVYDGKMYVASGNTVYCFDGAGWSVALSYEYAYAFLDMQVYDGKLYLATRDLNRIPLYVGGTGFSGTLIEYDGENWTTILGHDYWMYSLEVYDGKLYVGTANRIYTYNGTAWDVSFHAENGAFYAISMITYNDKIYAGMGNGYIFADPAPAKAEQETITVPEFSSTAILAVFMTLTMLAGALTRKNRSRRFS
jgi:hypothetical protein